MGNSKCKKGGRYRIPRVANGTSPPAPLLRGEGRTGGRRIPLRRPPSPRRRGVGGEVPFDLPRLDIADGDARPPCAQTSTLVARTCVTASIFVRVITKNFPRKDCINHVQEPQLRRARA